MDKKESEKILHDNLSAEVIAALDARYYKSDEQKQSENPIVAKKQKIADFVNSLDDDEKILLSMVVPNSKDLCSLQLAAEICSETDNPCDDYQKLIYDRYKEIMSKLSESMEGAMTGKITLFGL